MFSSCREKAFAEAYCYAAKATSYPASVVPWCVASNLAIALRYDINQKSFYCYDDIDSIEDHIVTSEVPYVCPETQQ